MIEQINKLAEIWWNWMWPMFWQVSILICLIAIIDFFIRKYIWPQVRYALWLLVLVKLILPPSFALPTGLVSYIQPLYENPIRQTVTKDGLVTSEYINENENFSTLSNSKLTQPKMLTELSESNETMKRTKPVLSWHSIAMIGWLLITFLLMLRLFVRHHMLWQVHCEQECDLGLPKWLPKLINETAKKLCLKQTPQVVLSSTISCPAVFGIFKPKLLIPAEKINIISRDDVENILLHEMTHIKRKDLLLHTLCVLLQIVYWFNPLIILVRRQLQHLRELCCDAKIAEILKEKTEAYSQTILQTVEWLVNRPRYHGIGLLGLIEDPCRLRVRLKCLRKKPSRHPNLRKATAFILVLAMFVFILPMARAEKTTGEDKSVTSEDKKQSATSLHQAAADGDLEQVKLLISKGADVDDRNNGGRTPLHSAAYEGNVDIVKFLIGHGADVNAKDKRRQITPLHRAAIKGNLQTVEILIANGADVNANAQGATPLFEAMKSSAVGRKEIVELLVAKGAKVPALHLAAYRGDMETVKKCLQDGVDINSREDIGSTALHIAAGSGKKDIVEFLIGKGAQPSTKDKWGWTPLLYAASHNYEDIVDLLLAKGANIEEKDERGNTLLHYAIWGQDKNAVKLLIDKGADVNIQDENGYTSLFWSMWLMSDKEIVERLINKGANINAEDKQGHTPIYWATMMGRKDALKLLIAKGAALDSTFHHAAATGDLAKVKDFIEQGTHVDVKDKVGLTALQWSIMQNHKDIAKFLINKGANINAKIQQGQTLLHQACSRGNKDMTEFLIAKGADIEARNRFGATPLIVAIGTNKAEIAKFLIAKGANINAKNNKGQTLLHQACSRGNKDIVEFLISEGVDINAMNNNGQAPLHLAAHQGNIKAVQLLINHGADVNAKDNEGLTPLLLAKEHQERKEYQKIIDILHQHGAQEEFLAGPDNPEPTMSLHNAVKAGDVAEVKKLISEGADINAGGSEGGTALLTAIFNDDVNMVKLLIDKGADCNVYDNRGNTPLIWAITAWGEKDKEIVELLISGGANINLEDKKGGRTPVYWAAFHGSKRVFESILAKLTDPNTIHFAALKGDLVKVKAFVQNSTDVNAKDKFGCTPLHWAVLANSNDVADFLIAKGADVNAKDNNGLVPLLGARRLGMIGFLISKGADVNVKDDTFGYTKLHSACLENDRDMAAFLISKGAGVNTKNNWGMMPLHNAIRDSHRELVELLIANGADVNIGFWMGTPLHLAVLGGHRDIAELLITKGADVNAKNKSGQTALDIAVDQDHAEIVELLRKHRAKE